MRSPLTRLRKRSSRRRKTSSLTWTSHASLAVQSSHTLWMKTARWPYSSVAWRSRPSRTECMQALAALSKRTNQIFYSQLPGVLSPRVLGSVSPLNSQVWLCPGKSRESCTINLSRTTSSTYSQTRKSRRSFRFSWTQRTQLRWKWLLRITSLYSIRCLSFAWSLLTWFSRRTSRARSIRTCLSTGSRSAKSWTLTSWAPTSVASTCNW